ncbi:MAG: hypothetical protein GEU90_15280 [Gemmatimonas sp.]|nr:hypothetical protein [Gemmatimonas sp.]
MDYRRWQSPNSRRVATEPPLARDGLQPVHDLGDALAIGMHTRLAFASCSRLAVSRRCHQRWAIAAATRETDLNFSLDQPVLVVRARSTLARPGPLAEVKLTPPGL